MQDLAIILGVFLAAYALRTFGHPLLRRVGALLFLAGSYLAGYLLVGSHWAGAACVALWFVLPWLEILLRIRRMTLPLEKNFRHRLAPSREEFPQLQDITREIDDAGFEQADDTGWDWEDMRQFVRFFVNPDSKIQAAIHLNQQGGLAIVFVSVVTRTRDGQLWTTWNYPFAYTMKLAPGFRLNRASAAGSFGQLLTEHQQFLVHGQVRAEEVDAPDPEGIPQLMEKELRRQIDHNLDEGILQLSGEGRFRYSWRGCFFLWREFVKDMVRLS